jgi:hypothetical protein
VFIETKPLKVMKSANIFNDVVRSLLPEDKIVFLMQCVESICGISLFNGAEATGIFRIAAML